MDDLVDELEENITYEDLYKLHTGHRLFQHSDDSDTSSESSISRYEHLKPPPYSYAELTENLVVVEKSVKKESKSGWKIVSTNSSYLNNCHSMIQSTEPTTVKDLPIFELTECKQTPETPKCKQTLTPSETVAEKLSQLITEEHCLICDNRNKTHYRQYGHYKNTMKWLETQLKVIKQPVNMELLFCHICNLPLSGNEKAKIHYQEKFHNENAKSFCVPCLRFIEAVDMPSHRTSKKHLANIGLAPFSVSELKKSKNQSSATTHDSLQEKKEYRIPNLSKPSKDLVKEYDQYSAPTYESFQDRKENQIPNLSKPSQDANKQNENLSLTYASVLKKTLSIKSILSDCKMEDVNQCEPLKCHITEKPSRTEKVPWRQLFFETQHYCKNYSADPYIGYIRDKLATIAGLETHKQLQQKLVEADDRIRELEGQLEVAGGGQAEQVPEHEGSATEQATEEQPPAESEEVVPPAEESPEENPDAAQ